MPASLPSTFEAAADAVVTGDTATLASLLQSDPSLVRARSERPHRATLLHYVGANGVEAERQRTPPNALDITATLLKAGAEVDATADIYSQDTALGLVATSIYPLRAGLQQRLMKLLLQHGAAIDGAPGNRSIIIAALHNGRREASEFLAEHGASLDLESAAGVGRLDLVKAFFPQATETQRGLGFLWACEYGRNEVAAFLLDSGVDIAAHHGTGLTGLHWAVVGGQLPTIKLLLQRGAPLEIKNRYGGTALGQALWSAMNSEDSVDYVPIVETLLKAGAIIEDGSLEYTKGKLQLADLLRIYGATS